MSAQLIASGLTRAEIDQLIAWNETGDPSNILKVYDYLASKGDEYADNAKEVVQEALTGVAPTSVMGAFFNTIVKIHWTNASGPSAYSTYFTAVAKDYQARYLQLFIQNAASGFAWPTTPQIEQAYRDAMVKTGLLPIAAIDGVVSKLDLAAGGSGTFSDVLAGRDFSWAWLLGMGPLPWQHQPYRIEYNSKVFADLTFAQALRTAIADGRDIAKLAAGSTTWDIGKSLAQVAFPPLAAVEMLYDWLLNWTDRMGLYGLFMVVDPKLKMDTAEGIVDAAAADSGTLLSQTLGALGKVLNLPVPNFANREAYYNTLISWISQIENAPPAVTLVDLSAKRPNELAALAKSDIAYRYALKELNPFAVLGVDYSAFNTSGELDRLDPATGSGTLSDKWLDDRAAMLAWANRARTDDTEFGPGQLYADAKSGETDGNVWNYTDYASNQSVVVRPGGVFPGTHYVAFGSDIDGLLTGGSLSDNLYGMAGNDTLVGQAGDDYLEGNQGNDSLDGGTGNDTLVGGPGNDSLSGGDGTDTYIVGQGDDTITDTDKKGYIELADNTLIGGLFVKGDDGRYAWMQDPAVTAEQQGSKLVVKLKNGATVTIENFDFAKGSLGIQLKDKPATLTPTNTITGDKNTNKNDTLTGTAASDLIDGLTGDDSITGGAGDDKLLGGAGMDIVSGDEGNDLVSGGADKDILAGREGDDRLYADGEIALAQAIANGNTDTASGQKGDWLSGGPGDDVLVAGADNDVLCGGLGRDILVGGAGNDALDGDDDYTATSFDWTVTPAEGNEFDRQYSPIDNRNDYLNPPSSHCEDVLYGGAGDDNVYGGAGDDILYGDAGTDTLSGGGEDDVLFGGAGDDRMTGDMGYLFNGNYLVTGDDYLDGEAGNDWLQGEAGDDILYGGTGNDSLLGDAVFVNGDKHGSDFLDGEEGDDILWGQGGDDVLIGGDGNDYLDGDYDPAVLSGQYHGNDDLDGGAGNDSLIGGAGDDILDGGAGDDYYEVGAGDGPLSDTAQIEGITDDGGIDTLAIDADVAGAQVVGNDLVIAYGNGDAIGIKDGASGSIENFEVNGQAMTFARFIGNNSPTPGHSPSYDFRSIDRHSSDQYTADMLCRTAGTGGRTRVVPLKRTTCRSHAAANDFAEKLAA